MNRIVFLTLFTLVMACGRTEPGSPRDGELLRTEGQSLSVPAGTVLPTEVGPDGAAVGNLQGQAGVGSDGSATYSIPLWVPPGRAGLQPSLSLSYRSNLPNGLLGVGWSLSGLSQITRCSKNMAADGVSMPVTFTQADSFCLDGQKLIAVNGQYGASNTEYRTETDTFSKIVSHSSDANGPKSFTVLAKDGRILNYGNIEANAVFQGNRVAVRPQYEKDYATTRDTAVSRYSWGLTSIIDRVDNVVAFHYGPIVYDASDNSYEQVLSHITYTSSLDAAQASLRHVNFSYDTRPAKDIRTAYVAGFKIKSSQRLKSLQMRGPDEVGQEVTLRTYEFTYAQEAGSDRSLLSSLKECDGGGKCKRPMTFEWTQPANSFTTVNTQITDASIIPEFATLQPGDVNGDGLDDLIYRAPASTQYFYKWRTSSSTGTAFAAPVNTVLPETCWYSSDGEDGRWFDFNLDGLLDVSIVKKDGCQVTPPRTMMNYVGGSNGFSLSGTGPSGRMFLADLDGSGLMNPVQITMDGPNGHPQLSFRPIIQGTLWAFQPITLGASEWHDFIQYAVNLDGLPRSSLLMERKVMDSSGFVLSASNRLWALEKRNGVYVKTETTLLLPTVDEKVYLFADINGDGLPDAILSPVAGGDIEIMMNTGNGFAAPVAQVLPAFAKFSSWDYDNGVRVLDYNHDGRQDLLLMDKKGSDRTKFVLLLSNGTSFDPQELAAITVSDEAGTRRNQLSQVLDMNGDGLADFVQPVNGQLVVYRQNGQRPGLLKGVKDSMNSGTTFTYKPISDTTVHARGTDCGYPNTCSRQGHWVVAESQTDAGEGHPVRVKRYFYEDGRFDVTGRGWLGFKAMTVQDVQAGTETRTEYDVTTRVDTFYPYAATPIRERVRLQFDGWTTEREREIHYRSVLRPGTVSYTKVLSIFPVNGTEIERNYATEAGPNAASAFVRTTQTSWTYDDTYGNLTDKTQSTVGGDQVAWHAEYSNSPSSWLVGLPTLVTESSTVNGQTVTRRKSLTYQSWTGFLLSETSEPGDPNLEQTTTYGRTRDGLASRVTRSGAGILTPRVTQITYDSFDRGLPASITNAAGHVTEFAYHRGLGVLAAVRDERGVETRWQYDGFGRLRKEDAPDQSDTEVHYTQLIAGTAYTTRVTTSVAGGQTVTVDYDRLGRSVRSSRLSFNGTQAISTRKFDALGRVVEVTDPDPQGGATGMVTAYQYDPLNRLLKTTHPDGSVSSAWYRGYREGFQVTTTDENGNSRRFLNDVNGRVIKSMERTAFTAPWLESTYQYGPFGQLQRVLDPQGNETLLGYDRLGRRTSLRTPDSGLTTTRYTALGEIDRTEDASQVVTTYVRDVLGRPVTVTSSRDGVDRFTWDTPAQGPSMPGLLMGSVREGDPATTTDDIAVAYGYDTLGRLTQEQWLVEGRAYAIDRSYDAYGRSLSLEYPAVAGTRLRLGYEYTSQGYLRSVRDLETLSEKWKVLERNALGQLTSESLGNGVVTQRLYDSMGRLRFIDSQKGTVPLQQLAYEYQPNGNVRSRHDRLARTTEDFHYDGLDRLTEWNIVQNCRNTIQSYSYDDLGNLLGWTSTLGASESETFTYGAGPAGPHALTGSQAGSYGYDASGNQTSAPGRTVEFTGFHLPSRIMDGQQSVSYRYSANNARTVKRHSDGTMTTYVGGLYEERREPGGAVTHSFHVSAAERGIAEVTWRVEAASGVAIKKQWRYMHSDHLGSTESVTDDAGLVVGRMKYDPFGARRHPLDLSLKWQGASHEVRHSFTGHEQDSEFELVNMRGRIYDPRLGRFLSPDPVVQAPLWGQSFNRYSYVLNNPLRYTDPSGFMSMELIYYYDSWYGAEIGRDFSNWTEPVSRSPASGYGPGLFERSPNYEPVTMEIRFGDQSYTSLEQSHLRSTDYSKGGEITESITLLETTVYHPDEVNVLLTRLTQGLGGGLMGVMAGLLPAGHLLPIPEDQTQDFYRGYGVGMGAVSLMELYAAAGMFVGGVAGEGIGGAISFTGVGAAVGVPVAAVSAAAVAGSLVVGAEGVADATKGLAVFSSAKDRSGKSFTRKGRDIVVEENRARNGGDTVCENCGTTTVPSQQSRSGVRPPGNETQVDHVIPESKGGKGSPENGQVLCRDCNREKGDKYPWP
ncbi:Rhs family-like protein [Corallococcus coralloides]|uniref:Rhs family-like protein n=2 Tax=Corallococcus coralloides TaxID=184914 RepID=A0A410RWQ2_CORCK|nr:Rhs family-like protein [Corallococcus coralloides]